MDFSFFGSDLTTAQYELAALSIDPNLREGEADLYRTRWFDYAGMHPAKATYLFAHYYRLQLKRFCEVCIDARTASERATSASNDVFTSKYASSMWSARRVCDSVGCPYDFALEFAQGRAIDRMMRFFPRPNQISGEDFEIDLRDAWNLATTYSLRYSKSKAFKVRNYTGTFVQKRHIESLVRQVQGRAAESHAGLLGRLMSESVLAANLLNDYFCETTILKAVNIADSLSQ